MGSLAVSTVPHLTKAGLMHISEGILSPALLGGGWAATIAGLTYGMKRTQSDEIPRVALVSAAFFVITFVRLPLGAAHLHLAGTGLVGILLGWSAFPALFIALMLQAVLFQFGGLSVLGANTLLMALPAVAVHYLFKRCVRSANAAQVTTIAGVAGALAVAGNILLMALLLIGSDPAFAASAMGVTLLHVPLIAVEGVITALAVSFLCKVRPDLLPNASGA